MPLVRIKDIGAIGVNKDLSAHELPPNAWTDAENVRFIDGYAQQFLGHMAIYGTPEIVPYHLLPVYSNGTIYWVYAGSAKIYAVTSSGGTPTHTNITRQTASADVDYTGLPNAWTSCVITGVPVINPGNETDVPQRWDTDASHKCQALDNWPASTYCKAMRSYKNFLIALNVTKTTTNYPYMVKWSHPSVAGSVPSSWDETDATKDAGEYDLSDGYDRIVDGLALRDSFMIYKESSIWRMDYTGGPYVFRFSKVLGNSGAFNRNCIVEVDGLHFVLTNNDVILHDGQGPVSILDKQTRRHLFNSIDTTNFARCFVFKNPYYNEVFVCYPETGSASCNKAMVWNYKDRTISFRDLPNIYHAAFGGIDTSTDGSWATSTDTWESATRVWGGGEFVKPRLVMASADTLINCLDETTQFNGSAVTSYVERRGLAFGSDETMKTVTGIRPRINGANGDTVTISVGFHNTDPYAEPDYTEMTHTIGTTVANDCLVSGRYLAFKFASGTAATWRLDSYDIDLVENGKF